MEGSISGIAENEEGNNGEPHCRVERGDVQDRDESVDCVREIVSKMRIFQFLQTPLTSPPGGTVSAGEFNRCRDDDNHEQPHSCSGNASSATFPSLASESPGLPP